MFIAKKFFQFLSFAFFETDDRPVRSAFSEYTSGLDWEISKFQGSASMERFYEII